MTFDQLVAEARAFPRTDRIRFVETLTRELAKEDEILGMCKDAPEIPMWSPI